MSAGITINKLFFLALLALVGCKSEPTSVEGSVANSASFSSSALDFGEVQVSSPIIKTFTISNGGEFPLSNIRAVIRPLQEQNDAGVTTDTFTVFKFTGDDYPGVGGNCESEVPPGESCVLELTLDPFSSGLWSQVMKIDYTDVVGPKSREIPLTALVGNAASLSATIEGESGLDLGLVEAGSTRQFRVKVENSGELTAKEFSLQSSGSDFRFTGGSYPGAAGTCGDQIAGESFCYFEFDFSTGTNGLVRESFLFTYMNPSSESFLDVDLKATHVNIAALLKLDTNEDLEFDATLIGQSSTITIPLVNAGFAFATNIGSPGSSSFSLQSTTCGELGVGDTCEAVVAFTPTARGEVTETLPITYFDSRVSKALDIELTATGAAPANLEFDLASFDFGDVAVNTSATQTIWVENKGDVPSSIPSASGLSAPLTVVFNGCNAVPAGARCFVSVQFSPLTVGAVNQTLSLAYNNGLTSQSISIPIAAEGVAAALLSLSEQTHNFGVVKNDELAQHTFTITNGGYVGGDASSVTIANLEAPFQFAGGGAFPGVGGSCGPSIAAGASCTFVLEFAPTSGNSGLQDLSVTLSYNDGFTMQNDDQIALEGRGATLGRLSFATIDTFDSTTETETGSVTFAKQSLTHPIVQNLRLRNTGGFPATNIVIGFQSNGSDTTAAPYTISHNCPGTLAGFSSCNLTLTFTPTSVGTFTDTYIASYDNDDGAQTPTELDISGEGENMAYFLFSSTADLPNLNFGNTVVGADQDINLTIENQGQIAGVLSNFLNFPPGAEYSYVNSDCLPTIPAGSSCNVVYTHAPTALGYKQFNYSFDYYDGVKTLTYSGIVQGTGVEPAQLSLDPNPEFDFDLVIVDTTVTRQLTVRNIGGFQASSLSFSAQSAPWALTDSACGTELAAGAQCTINVAFSPTSADVGIQRSTDVSVSYFDGAESRTASDGDEDEIESTTFLGKGEPPTSVHNGWSEIYAEGDKLDGALSNSGGAKVRLKWNAMAPTGAYAITGYKIYRRPASQENYIEGPQTDGGSVLGTTTTSTLEYTDNSIVGGQVYFYRVNPIILGESSRLPQNFAEIRVASPQDNMVLVHRRMANRELCSAMGLTSDRLNFNRCSYSGVGSTDDFLDLGYDLLVDRYELSYSPSLRQYLPLFNATVVQNLTQVSAQDACDARDIEIAIDPFTLKRRLPSRKEQLLYSLWPEGLSGADIEAKEQASAGSSSCNDNGTGLERSGQNALCMSRFGVFDAAGNAFEWVQERLFQKKGLTNSELKIDPDNEDFDNLEFDFDGVTTFSDLSSEDCFQPILGVPFKQVSGSCPNDSELVSSFGGGNLHQNQFFPPQSDNYQFLMVGGNFQSNNKSGRYTHLWAPLATPAGARCVSAVEY